MAQATILNLLRACPSKGLAYRSANTITSTKANTPIKVRASAAIIHFTDGFIGWLLEGLAQAKSLNLLRAHPSKWLSLSLSKYNHLNRG